MKLLFFITFSIFFLIKHPAIAQKFNPAEFKEKVERQIKAEGKTPEEKYHIYALFGRELLGLKKYELAREYYSKALKQKTSKPDKSESYLNLVYIAHAQKRDKEFKSALNQLEKAIEEKELPEDNLKNLRMWKALANASSQTDERVMNSFQGAYYAMEKVKALVQEKKYAEALELFPTDAKNSSIGLKIQKDILTKLVNPKAKSFLCEATLKRYPSSISYSMLICRKLKNQNSPSLEEIKKQIKREAPDKMIWANALEDLK